MFAKIFTWPFYGVSKAFVFIVMTYTHESNEDKAIDTLRHEFIDYVVS
jgi:hypothetical protein